MPDLSPEHQRLIETARANIAQPEARTAHDHAETVQDSLRSCEQAEISKHFVKWCGKCVPCLSRQALHALLAQVERLEQERDEAHRLLNTTIPASAVLATMDASARAEAAEARAEQAERERDEWREAAIANRDLANANAQRSVQAERERDEALERAKALGKVSWNATQRRQAAEARAQRYREALTHYAKGAGYSTIIARRALSADPLVCRDPDLCWGTGTCPRDPACNE